MVPASWLNYSAKSNPVNIFRNIKTFTGNVEEETNKQCQECCPKTIFTPANFNTINYKEYKEIVKYRKLLRKITKGKNNLAYFIHEMMLAGA